MLATPARRIELRPHSGGYLVEVLPPFPEGPNHDGWYASYKSARGSAGGLRLVLGLPLLDLCDRADG
jgi:hypothetical protein